MSVTAVGPALGIDGPLPVAPPYSLLSTPGVLAGTREWLNGVNVWGYPCGTPDTWEPCSEGTFREKSAESEWNVPRFDSFAAQFPFECSTISGAEEFARRAEAVIEATISFAVEEALAQGVDGSSNPFFGDGELDAVAAGAAVTPAVGLSYLENAIGATGRAGMIHATPAVVAAWGFDKLATNGAIRTTNGTLVVSGGGYIGADPVSESTPAAGQDWAFATGPVRVFVEDAVKTTLIEYVDRATNLATYRAEKYVVAMWDTCLQSAALIDWSP